jgi:transposase-like protein
MHTMPEASLDRRWRYEGLLAENGHFLRPLVQALLQELLEAEMTEALGAENGERTPQRIGYRGVRGLGQYAGLTQATVEVLPEAAWPRCYMGLLKNPPNAVSTPSVGAMGAGTTRL